MGTLFNERQYDLFLSHAHADHVFVRKLYDWLTTHAGLKVFYDPKHGTAGTGISSMLRQEIENCRGVVLVVSESSVDSEWVKDEYDMAKEEHNENPDFRIVPVRLGGAPGKRLLKGISWIDVADGAFTSELALALLRGVYGASDAPDPARTRDIYVSASWKTDNTSALAISTALIARGFRLIGDAKDQDRFDVTRIERIMRTCGAFVCVVPFRDQPEASAARRPYKYYLQEIDIARRLDLASVIIADPRIKRVDGDDSHWLRMATDDSNVSREAARKFDIISAEWEGAPLGNHVFVALPLATETSPQLPALREVVSLVTDMATVFGIDLQGQRQAEAIQRCIGNAALVIGDITGDNVNVCIELGMAKATERPYELISEGPTRSGPFMIRGPNIGFYANDVERIGALHRIARPHRRRVLNQEL
jgi:TIR domain